MSQESSIETYHIGAQTPVPYLPIATTLAASPSSTVFHTTAPAPLLRQIRARLAFERTSTRLYEVLLDRIDVSHTAPRSQRGALERETLVRFRNEEAAHFELLCEALVSIGADPLVELDNIVSDPISATVAASPTGASLDQSEALEILLDAEQADEAGWRRLVASAHAYGMDELAHRFEHAHAEEIGHVRQLLAWRAALTAAQRRVA